MSEENREQTGKPGIRLPRWSLRTWILIVVVAVVLGTGAAFWGWWSSWSLPEWSTTTYEYANGPTVLEEVHDIGQLVASEYYGEVIHSWLEVQEKSDWLLLSDLYDEVKRMYTRHYDAAQDLPIRRGPSDVQRDAFNRFVLRISTLSEVGWYRQVLLKTGQREAALLEEIRRSDWLDFARKYDQQLQRARRVYRQETLDDPVLIYLGRGDVLLGYDLSALDSTQMEWKGDSLIIHECSPVVIAASINPWYITPDQDSSGQGIPGFEALRQSGNITSSMTEQVKKGCKAELIRQAFQHGAADLAEQTAEETLLNFFNLLLKPEEQLSFLDIRPTDRYLDIRRWTSDGLIDTDELAEIRQELTSDSLSGEWFPVLRMMVQDWGQTPDWGTLRAGR